jgi:hypothetical protein
MFSRCPQKIEGEFTQWWMEEFSHPAGAFVVHIRTQRETQMKGKTHQILKAGVGQKSIDGENGFWQSCQRKEGKERAGEQQRRKRGRDSGDRGGRRQPPLRV